MYKKIKSHPTTRTLYAERLINECGQRAGSAEDGR